MANTYYFDITKKGQDILGTKDVPVIKNDQAIKESIINLLSTEIGTRPMLPQYGVDLNKYLFEPIDDITADLIEFEIYRGLSIYEPRINNIEITVIPTIDELSYTVNISYNIIYTNSKEALQVDFAKIR